MDRAVLLYYSIHFPLLLLFLPLQVVNVVPLNELLIWIDANWWCYCFHIKEDMYQKSQSNFVVFIYSWYVVLRLGSGWWQWHQCPREGYWSGLLDSLTWPPPLGDIVAMDMEKSYTKNRGWIPWSRGEMIYFSLLGCSTVVPGTSRFGFAHNLSWPLAQLECCRKYTALVGGKRKLLMQWHPIWWCSLAVAINPTTEVRTSWLVGFGFGFYESLGFLREVAT